LLRRKFQLCDCARFASIAVEKGFITAEQAKAALAEQLDDDLARKKHRLIGHILFEKDWISPKEIDLVLSELFQKAS
jgi:hypothetical protein